MIKTLTLRPYPGTIKVCTSKKEYKNEHKKLFGYSISLKGKYGRMDGHGGKVVFLVWACDDARLAHELSHVILHTFELAGIDPRDANGEPFCYLLSQLILDCCHREGKE
jgi:hypothetical protein